jgi:hypothetical protein
MRECATRQRALAWHYYYRFIVSRRVKEVLNNGDEYRRLHGKTLSLPERKADWPRKIFFADTTLIGSWVK